VDQRPPRADRDVDRRGWGGPEQVVADREGGAPERPRHAGRPGAGGAGQARHPPGRAEGLERAVLQRHEREAGPPRRRFRGPVVGWLRLGVVGEVEEQHPDLDRRLPVDQRVVHLADHAAAAVVEPRREVDAPERATPVERLGQRVVGELREARPAHGLRSEQSDVLGDVEVGIIHPTRLADSERRERQPAPEQRRVAQPARDRAAKLVEPRPVAGGRPQQSDPGHVHVGVRRLQVKERRVEGRQTGGHPESGSRRGGASAMDCGPKSQPPDSTGGRAGHGRRAVVRMPRPAAATSSSAPRCGSVESLRAIGASLCGLPPDPPAVGGPEPPPTGRVLTGYFARSRARRFSQRRRARLGRCLGRPS
jgi:hypothetical protein